MAKIDNSMESLNALVDMMASKGVRQLQFADKDIEISIEMNCGNSQTVVSTPVATAASQAPAQAPAPMPHGNVVKSPIVGTFYSSASPDDKPFATVGKKVSKGDVLFIIESMKVMNEIKSDFDGTVITINCKSGEAVEFDQPVMIIE